MRELISLISLYAAIKRSGELLAYAYHYLHGFKIVGLRFFTVYGPWGRPDMAYFKFADLIIKNKPIEIYNYGKMKRDFTYIDDTIEGIVTAIKKDFNFEIINLGNNKPEKLTKLIELLEQFLNKKAKRKYLPLQAGGMINTWADIRKAQKLPNYNPKTTISVKIL